MTTSTDAGANFADKALYWKARALSAESALREFALRHPMGDNYVKFSPDLIRAARDHFDVYVPQNTILGAA